MKIKIVSESLEENIKKNEEAMGGVSAPMSTLNNTPGMGNAQPADTAATTGVQQASSSSLGSGDAWGGSLGTYTQDGTAKKKPGSKKKKKSTIKKASTKTKRSKRKPGHKKPGPKKKNESLRIKPLDKF